MKQKRHSTQIQNWMRKLLCLSFYFIEFFALKSQLVHRFYNIWIGDIFVDEYHMADVTIHDYVLHIGCGCLPTMSVLAAQEAQAKVVAIDNNEKTAQRAQHFICEQHLSNIITVEVGDGRTYSAAPFDVIFIAINVVPIDVVFRHLASWVKPQVRIICRDLGIGVIHMLQNEEFSSLFTIQNIRKHGKISSLLITKKR